MSITAISPLHALAARASEPRASAAVAALPDMPKPVTPTTAAGYLMQVPSARVLEALASLQRAMGQQAPTQAARQLAQAVSPPAESNKLHLEA